MLTFVLVVAGIIVAASLFGYFYLQRMNRNFAEAKEQDEARRQERLDNLPSIPLSARDDDGIYQWSFHHGERLVARVIKPEVDEAARQIRFMEVTESDLLLLPDECHFQKYKLEIDTVGDAVKIDKMDPAKGRILREVTAQITGYVEQ